jgi:hypothetical protein
MSLTVNAKTYTADSFGTTKVGYVGSLHTVSVKDDIQLSRVVPKPTTTFSGVGRTSAKLTRTSTLTGALTPTWDAILEISVTTPVGMASADIDALLNDMGAFLASATYKTHVKGQTISY